jgi:hypothetical protein
MLGFYEYSLSACNRGLIMSDFLGIIAALPKDKAPRLLRECQNLQSQFLASDDLRKTTIVAWVSRKSSNKNGVDEYDYRMVYSLTTSTKTPKMLVAANRQIEEFQQLKALLEQKYGCDVVLTAVPISIR